MRRYTCFYNFKEVRITAKNQKEAAVRTAIWACIQTKIGQRSKIFVEVYPHNNYNDKSPNHFYYVDVENMTARKALKGELEILI